MWTTDNVHTPVHRACQRMIVVDDDLAWEGKTQERACVNGGWGGRVEEYEVVGASMELWRRMEMPFLKKTVADRHHCWMVVSSDELSKRWHEGNDDGVASSGAGGS